MSGTQANARIWSQCDIYVGDVGTTAPDDIDTDLDAGFELVGYLDEDPGVAFDNPRDTTDHIVYGGDNPRTGVKNERHTMKFVGVERNPVMENLLNPGGTIATVGGVSTVDQFNYVPNPKAWVAVMTDGDVVWRRSIPRGEIVQAVDTQTVTDDGLAKYGLTVNIYTTDKKWCTDISNDPALAV